ncbi:hypothetical protein [Pandoraea sputorum]|uniref:hypothetical protein n=1 Tax=Pandoraea sputorum TaxID=93222 RepID=UPI001242CED4|nr:hypothetical protein [Pandoraea sputorum]VVE06673.1 ABC transporter permease [Pandoraea sputorum]
MSDPTARAEFRAALLSVLALIPDVRLFSPGDWTVPATKLPAMKVRQGKDKKESNGVNGQTAFTTVSIFEILVEVSAVSGPAALVAIETFAAQIEEAIFKSTVLRKLAQDFPFMETETHVSADGETHIGGMHIVLGVQFFETFTPDVTNTLEGIDLTADLINVADPNGTYPDPPFPGAVTPAPRTQGPDGRAEGGVSVQFNS